MLNLFRRKTAKPNALQFLVVGTTTPAKAIAEGARAAGHEVVQPPDASLLLDRKERTAFDGIILATGNEAEDLAFARRMAADWSPRPEPADGWTVLGIAAESQPVLTAIQDLDSEVGAVRLRLRPLSMFSNMARQLLLGDSFAKASYAGQPAHAVVFGTGPSVEQVVLELFRMMHLPALQPRVTVVGPQARAFVDDLLAAVPGLGEVGTLAALPSWPGAAEMARPSAIYVSDAAVWANAQSVEWYVPVYWLPDAQGPPPTVAEPAPPSDWREAATMLFSDPVDRQAEAIHQIYLEERRQAGDAMGTRPSMQPWAYLPERFRAASRHQADHIGCKLAAIGCRIGQAGRGPRLAFTSGEVELMAEAEHRRWAAVQMLDGWRYGDIRDDRAKQTPLLVPYERLTPEIKDLDRLSVRAMQTQLDRAGKAVQRNLIVETSADPAAAPAAGFDANFLRVLQEIAARYPNMALVVRTTLGSPLECRVAEIALEKASAALSLLVEDAKTPSPKAAALALRAETIHAGGRPPVKPDISFRCGAGDAPSPLARVIAMDATGHLRQAPWL